jgi:PAS domain S-box-containing protein
VRDADALSIKLGSTKMKPAVTAKTYEHKAPRLKRLLTPPKGLLWRVRWIFLLVGIFMAAFVLLPVLSASTPWLFKAAALVGLTLMAAVLHFLASTSAKHDRAVFRERTLRETSAALVAALDQKSIYTAALDGAQKLTKDMPGTCVGIAVGSSERMTILAAVGDHAADIEGAEVNLHNLPDPICTHLLEKRSVEVSNVDPIDSAVAQEALSFEPKTGSVYYVPLLIQEELGGLLVVASDSPLPSELKDSVEVLGSQAALAMESITLAEELYQQKSETRLRCLVRHSSDAITITEADGTVSYMIPAVERVLGYKPEDLIGANRWELIHPDELPEAQRLYHEYLQKQPGSTLRAEYRMRHHDGSWRYIESITNNLLDDPDIGGIVINCRDITERKRVEGALRRESVFVQLLQAVAVAANETATVEYAVQVCLDEVCAHTGWPVGHAYLSTGYPTGELIPTTLWYLEDPERFETFRKISEDTRFAPEVGLPGRVLASGKPAWITDVTEDPNFPRAKHAADIGVRAGFAFPVLVGAEVAAVLEFFSAEAVGPDEQLLEVMANVGTQLGRAIERNRAEEALRKSEAHNRAVVDTASDAIITMSEDGLIRSFNRAAEDIFGYSSPEIIGQPLRVLMPERFRESHEAGLCRYLKSGETHVMGKGPIELAGLRKSGEEFPLELSIGEMREGEDLLFTGIIRDITERKRTEEEIRRLNQNLERRVAERTAQLESTVADLKQTEESLRAYAARLKQSNRELQNFAHVASHDLQEPLRKVRTFGDRLKTKYAEALGEHGRNYLERMEDATARMQKLIEDLLALSRVTTQARPFAPVDLTEVAEEVVSDLEARIEQVGGRVEVGELPTVEADRVQMRQLLQNLIGNALKFHKEGEAPIVRVRGGPLEEWKKRDGDAADGRICRIEVEDNGIGFEEEHLDRIFVPFQRLHGRNTYEGTGMGLPICRKVVERHGGEITAKSAPGQGATFVVTLPIKQTRRDSEQL